MSSNTLLPLQGETKKSTPKPRALPWAKCLLAFQAVIIALSFASCSPIVQKHISKPLTPLDETRKVVVYDIGEMPPKYAEVIGSVRVENGLGRCDWDRILESAKKTARKAGGNGLEILQHAYPGDIDFCHVIVANILNIDPNNKPIELSEEAKQNFHDYVILKEGDTTRCIITDETNSTLTFIYEGQGIRRRTQIPKDKILTYHVDDPVALADMQYQRNKKVFHVRFGFDGGYAFRTAKFADGLSSDYKNYLRKLSRGPVLGANLRFDIDKMYTIGIHYNRFMSSNAVQAYMYDDYGNYFEGIVSDRHTINFFAMTAGYQYISQNEKHRFFFDYLIGYMNYYDIGEQFGDKFTIDGATLGMGMVFDYDYMLSKHVGIGAGLSYYSAALSKMNVNGYENNLGKNKEGLQRLNFKAGIRFYL
jgi:hypothetical protein